MQAFLKLIALKLETKLNVLEDEGFENVFAVFPFVCFWVFLPLQDFYCCLWPLISITQHLEKVLR